MTWTSPDPWHCYACGDEGLGGQPALRHHETEAHTPPALKPPVKGPVVPDGVDSRAVRAWARVNGWPNLGDRGRMPQAAIDAYLKAQP